MKRLLAKAAAVAAASLFLFACPGPNNQDGGQPDSGQPDGGSDKCAPSNFTTFPDQALNAPVATGVIVVKKTPNHPPLDGGLP